jgi:hypothetical protein
MRLIYPNGRRQIQVGVKWAWGGESGRQRGLLYPKNGKKNHQQINAPMNRPGTEEEAAMRLTCDRKSQRSGRAMDPQPRPPPLSRPPPPLSLSISLSLSPPFYFLPSPPPSRPHFLREPLLERGSPAKIADTNVSLRRGPTSTGPTCQIPSSFPPFLSWSETRARGRGQAIPTVRCDTWRRIADPSAWGRSGGKHVVNGRTDRFWRGAHGQYLAALLWARCVSRFWILLPFALSGVDPRPTLPSVLCVLTCLRMSATVG